jgi:hypothetical protein
LREGQWFVISLAGMGLAGAAYAASTSIPLQLRWSWCRLYDRAYNIARRLVVQRNTPREMRGG